MDPTSDGLIDNALGFLGLGPVQFLDDPGTALWSTMIMGIWMGAPYNMVIILAGLAGVDRSQYEAAAMDGVTLWQRLRHITLPAIRPALGIVLTLAAIRGLRVFTEVYVLTGGGPAGSTDVWMTRAYTLGFTRNDIGGASAASVVLLCVTLLLTVTVNHTDHHYWGGLRRTRELAAVCEAFGLGLSMHSNSHLGISLAAMTHVAAAIPNLDHSCDAHYPWNSADDVIRPGVLEFRDGEVAVPEGPGLGVELDHEALQSAAPAVRGVGGAWPRRHGLHAPDPAGLRATAATLVTRVRAAGPPFRRPARDPGPEVHRPSPT